VHVIGYQCGMRMAMSMSCGQMSCISVAEACRIAGHVPVDNVGAIAVANSLERTFALTATFTVCYSAVVVLGRMNSVLCRARQVSSLSIRRLPFAGRSALHVQPYSGNNHLDLLWNCT
jgi:hypothetical protein